MSAIAWQQDGLDAALALAAQQQRPLFLYWGAGWCPPCNRVKAELFSHPGVQQQLGALLSCWLDGDSHLAQAQAARYQLRSYPTLVLYAPDGAEITRLPCELDGAQFCVALAAALAQWQAGQRAASVLAAALDPQASVPDAAWTLLSHYSWDTDEGVLLQGRALAATLQALAARAAGAGRHDTTAAAAGVRLDLLAQLASAADGDPSAKASALLAVFSDAQLARANLDLLINSGLQLIKFATQREALVAALNLLASQWADDVSLSVIERLMAVRLQMRLSRLLGPSSALQATVQQRVNAALASATDAATRHALVNTAVSALHDAGLSAQAEQVLLDQLAVSHAPYYFMLGLASAAKRRRDTVAMLDWYERAAHAAVGAATRIQWNATWLAQVLDSAPADSAQAERAAGAVLAAIAASPDAHQQRNRSHLQKLLPALRATPENRGQVCQSLIKCLTGN